MVFRHRPPALTALLGVLLAVALLGITIQACAPLCEAKCCSPGACLSLSLNLDQASGAVPAAPRVVPAALLAVLAVLALFELPFQAPPFAVFASLPRRIDPGRRAPTRAMLHSWTL